MKINYKFTTDSAALEIGAVFALGGHVEIGEGMADVKVFDNSCQTVVDCHVLHPVVHHLLCH